MSSETILDQKLIGTAAQRSDSNTTALVYVDQTDDCIRRQRRGKGFTYIFPNGKPVRDRKTLERIRALAIPPAYTDVWICADPAGHIQATGRDQRGRKQYRYHADWNKTRDESKFGKLVSFAEALPALRRQIDKDMALRGLGRSKVLATVVHLLDRTLIRVGNAEYAKTNESFGLTTLQNEHVTATSATLRFRFKGKSGKEWNIKVSDRRMARIVKSIQELPGQELFQYVDDDGQVRDIGSASVNAYIRDIAGADFSAKDFRTWAATVMAAKELLKLGPSSSQRDAKSKLRQAIAEVARKLGNTVAVCRQSYVHPGIISRYMDGSLCDDIARLLSTVKEIEGLSRDETAVLYSLKDK